ncbi:pyruvate kinase, partial [Halobacteriales archaeon QS_9_70_65]
CPDGAVVVLPEPFDGEFTGDLGAVAALVAADDGMTSLPAIVARELGVPMVGDAALDADDGAVVTVDGDRGVVYGSDVTGR